MKRKFNKIRCLMIGTVAKGGMKTTATLLGLVGVSLSLWLASATPASAIASIPSAQSVPALPNSQHQSLTVAEIEALAKGGINEEVILSQIRSSHAVFHLTTEEILDLKSNAVSQKIIQVMINTANL